MATVGDVRKAIEGISDNAPVVLVVKGDGIDPEARSYVTSVHGFESSHVIGRDSLQIQVRSTIEK